MIHMQYVKLNTGDIIRYLDSASIKISNDRLLIDDEHCNLCTLRLSDIDVLDTNEYKMKLNLKLTERYYGGL